MLHFKRAAVMRLTKKWDMQNIEDGYCVRPGMALSLISQALRITDKKHAAS
jgi:hypothetical protein